MMKYNKLYFWLMIFSATQGFFIWGYSFSILNSLQDFLKNNLYKDKSTYELSLIASITTIGAIFGSVIAGKLGEKFGRRKTFIMNDCINILGVILTLIENYEVLILGRILIGIVIGIDTVLDPLYILEMSPPEIRGKAGSITISMYSASIFFALVLGYAIPKDENNENNQIWRVTFGILMIFSVFRLIMMLFVFKYDTPFFLLKTGQETKARECLSKINEEDVEKRIELYKKEIELMRNSEDNNVTLTVLAKKFKKALPLGIFLAMLQHLVGLEAVFVFSSTIFKNGNEDDDNFINLMNTLIGVVDLISSLVAPFVIDRFPRKKMLIVGVLALTAIMITVSILSATLGPSNLAGKIILLLWPIPYDLTLGPITFVYLSEMMPDIGMSVAIFSNWVASFLLLQFFLPLYESISYHGTFFIFSFFGILGLIVIKKFLFESFGKQKSEVLSNYV